MHSRSTSCSNAAGGISAPVLLMAGTSRNHQRPITFSVKAREDMLNEQHAQQTATEIQVCKYKKHAYVLQR
jgi:hypothetical protein